MSPAYCIQYIGVNKWRLFYGTRFPEEFLGIGGALAQRHEVHATSPVAGLGPEYNEFKRASAGAVGGPGRNEKLAVTTGKVRRAGLSPA